LRRDKLRARRKGAFDTLRALIEGWACQKRHQQVLRVEGTEVGQSVGANPVYAGRMTVLIEANRPNAGQLVNVNARDSCCVSAQGDDCRKRRQ
jgi:hypothetical protein